MRPSSTRRAAGFIPAALCMTVVLASVAGAEAPAKVDPAAAPEVQDVIFFTDARPYLIRLRVYHDGKPFTGRWTDFMNRLFAHFDRDGDGVLDGDEAKRLPSATLLQQMLQGNFFNYQAAVAGASGQLDANGDKKVTPAEMRAYFGELNRAGAFQIVGNPYSGNQANATTELLFGLLDRDKDGKLTKDELAKAAQLVAKYDSNDDELVTLQELQQDSGAYAGYAFVANPVGQQPRDLPVVAVPRESGPGKLSERLRAAKEVISRLDRDKNGKLSQVELGFPRELFERLDTKKDGELEPEELLRWLIVTPDMEIAVRLGKLGDKELAVQRLDGKAAVADANVPDLKGAGPLTLTLGKLRLDIVRNDGLQARGMAGNNQFFKQQFATADKESKKYVTEKDLAGPNLVYLRSIFAYADRDRDGKLTEKEIDAWFTLISSGVGCQTTLMATDIGQGLFEILDANADGRLGVRELNTAWLRLAGHDLDHDGAVTRLEIPRQYQFSLSPGAPNYSGGMGRMMRVQLAGGGFAPPTPPRGATPPRGPLWFRKMDRNSDGEVSRREFLGTAQDFARIDSDGDGFLTLHEAERADAALRVKQ